MRTRWTAVFSSILTSRKLAALPDDTCRYFYVSLLVFARPWGVFSADPRQLGAGVWPMLEKSSKTTEKALRACVEAGLVSLHEDDEGDIYGYIPDWETKAGSIGARKDKRGKPAFPIPTRPKSGLSPDKVETKSRLGPSVSVSVKTQKQGVKSKAVAWDLDEALKAHPVLDTPKFREAWGEYEAHRSEGKKKLTDRAARMQLKRLASWGPERARAAIEHSIANGYTGIFEVQQRGLQAVSRKASVNGADRPWHELKVERGY